MIDDIDLIIKVYDLTIKIEAKETNKKDKASLTKKKRNTGFKS